jgi:hypothetical protein
MHRLPARGGYKNDTQPRKAGHERRKKTGKLDRYFFELADGPCR